CSDCRAYLAKMEDAAALSCQELVELVTDYLEDRLPPTERERFETHLALCEGCQTYVDQIRATIALAGRLTEDAITPQAKEALLGAFRDWKRR
ncbi:MAG TPA: zf-HC2 domain-containing protein, partial [Chloroflexota bacterium]|nr:zf-HC2 domain-containing protein [Chloroflexota bacterium]